MNIAIIGAGAWGTAVAIHLDHEGHTVTLVPRRFEQAEALASSRENAAYLPGVELRPTLQIGFEILPAVMEAEVVLFATPSAGLREAATRVSETRSSAWSLQLVVALCKGLEAGTHRMAHQVLGDVFPDLPAAILSGPTHAMEVAKGFPTAMCLAGKGLPTILTALQVGMSNENLRVYTSPDATGVALGGCLKNVYAIAAGICDGLGLGDNAKAALLTRSLSEMVEVGRALGGQTSTFYGLSGVGDLIATCHGIWSRNRSFGEAIARGRTPEAQIAAQETVVEGYRTSSILRDWARDAGVETPILDEVYSVLYEGKSPGEGLGALMGRALKEEHRG